MASSKIGFISTRFAGTDGVSLESAKWAQVLWDMDRHVSFWYAGRLDRAPEASWCVPEAYFTHPANVWINQRVLGRRTRSRVVTRRIRELADFLKDSLYDFMERFDLDLLIPQNVLTIPMHIPLGLAVTELIAETGIPSIAHHHDFYWERVRFQGTSIDDYLDSAFPPRLGSIQHVVINQGQREELAWRKGIPAVLLPNVFDFEQPPPQIDHYSSDLRQEIGLEPDDVMILQPTRIVPRKGIEHAIKMVQMLGDPRYKLVISHDAGDEGFDYFHVLSELAHEAGVDIRFISTRIGEVRQIDVEGRKIYTLWDLYPHADFVTYFSTYEGFGNALLEAIYFKIPLAINRYEIFARDIEPLGLRIPTIDNLVTRRVVEDVRQLIEDRAYRQQTVDHNYSIASRFFSYAVARRKLNALISNFLGD
ncbi:glycosyltransferase family 4 protein [Planctomycetales bacterium ZRK34]|nr:glycosyltransferase family 4 protein [Planctomycetales bacterium ZRK34]